MNSRAAPSAIVIATTALLCCSCVGRAALTPAPFLGKWLIEVPTGFEHLALESDSRCEDASGETPGGAFIGILCAYTTSGNVITIDEMFDGLGARSKLPHPMVLEYVVEKDVLRVKSDYLRHLEFHRTTKTAEEIYISKLK